MSKKYCVSCGFAFSPEMADLDYEYVCVGCTAFSSKPESFFATYVPAVCGDSVCYLDADGMPNLDGDCSHESEFYSIFDQM